MTLDKGMKRAMKRCEITALDLPPESAANKIDKIGYETYMKRGMKRRHLMKTNMSAPGVSYLRNTWRFIHVSYTIHGNFIFNLTIRFTPRFIRVSCALHTQFTYGSYMNP